MSNINNILFDPELPDGNQEYKYSLINSNNDKSSQMNYRLNEGNGEAFYEIGLTDNGTALGLTEDLLNENINILTNIAKSIDANAKLEYKIKSNISFSLSNKKYLMMYSKLNNINISDIDINADRYIAHILVRRNLKDNKYICLRICVAGNVDAGKSTSIATLTHGELDNGDGKSRVIMFGHKHEIESGRTTNISQEIIGYDDNGNVVNELLKKVKQPEWHEIVNNSTKVCTFYDLCGHEKYFHTTIRGLTGIYPDYCFIMIECNAGITHITKEHMIICITNEIPMIIIFTKVDIAKEHIFKKNMEYLMKLLKSVKKPYLLMDNKEDIIKVSKKVSSIIPIIKISNTTGEGLDLLKYLIYLLNPRGNYHEYFNSPVKYSIEHIYQVNGIGIVLYGMLLSGTISTKEHLWLGPDKNGKFEKITIKSIHDKRVPVNTIFAGQSSCLAIKKSGTQITKKQVRRGMYVLDGSLPEPKATYEFIANIQIIGKHSTAIKRGYQPIINIGNITQSAIILKIFTDNKDNENNEDELNINSSEGIKLNQGDRAKVHIKFRYYPVYIEVGNKINLREGLTRGVGVIEELLS